MLVDKGTVTDVSPLCYTCYNMPDFIPREFNHAKT